MQTFSHTALQEEKKSQTTRHSTTCISIACSRTPEIKTTWSSITDLATAIHTHTQTHIRYIGARAGTEKTDQQKNDAETFTIDLKKISPAPTHARARAGDLKFKFPSNAYRNKRGM